MAETLVWQGFRHFTRICPRTDLGKHRQTELARSVLWRLYADYPLQITSPKLRAAAFDDARASVMNQPAETLPLTGVACPFCGLACDDLELRLDGRAATVSANGCARSANLFAAQTAGDGTGSALAGIAVPAAEAIAGAGELLRRARQPLISGLAADVGGVRAALKLADRVGAVVDHMNTSALMRNLLVLQDSGWITATFAEVRNRADFVLVVGTDGGSRFPRLVERLFAPVDSPFADGDMKRRMVFLGVAPVAPLAGIAEPRVIDCDRHRVGEVFGALRCLVAGRPLHAERAGGVAIDILRELAAEMQAARYGIVAWAAADLDMPHAELAIQSICGLVADLNETTRFAGLPLGGNDADITANQVIVWQTGFPLRSGFGRGVPEYDPYHYATEHMLAGGEADVLLWISAFDPQRVPPPTSVPTIVLGSPAMRFDHPPAVFIPVSTPGIHHAGHYFRSDNVMAVRLRKLVDSPLPSVAQALAAIEQAL